MPFSVQINLNPPVLPSRVLTLLLKIVVILFR